VAQQVIGRRFNYQATDHFLAAEYDRAFVVAEKVLEAAEEAASSDSVEVAQSLNLIGFRTVEGSVIFPTSAHIVTARK